jgi:hypothetical protein
MKVQEFLNSKYVRMSDMWLPKKYLQKLIDQIEKENLK